MQGNEIGNLGRKYDQQNIIDIALMLLPQWLNPFKKRSMKACLGNCNDFQVICSGMIARAFQSVGYPIVPALGAFENKLNIIKSGKFRYKELPWEEAELVCLVCNDAIENAS
ncbi:MAG: hypothetical protein ACE5I1_16875 [bacterium]